MDDKSESSQPQYRQIDTGRLKHLEMLQNVITRMASNSFLVKGWSITLLSAVLVLTVGGKASIVGPISLIPVVTFWLLDAFFLRQERLFRKLYDRYRREPLDRPTDFSMDTSVIADRVGTWSRVMVSTTLLIFYGSLLVLIGTVLFVSWCNK